MTPFIIIIASCAAICFYVAVRLRHELQMLQQNSYRPGRYLRWLRGDLANVARVTDLMMAGVLFIFRGNRWELYAVGFMGALARYKAIRQLRVRYKKPLVFTARAVRLYAVGMAIVLVAVSVFFWWRPDIYMATFTAMAAAALSPVVMLLSLMVLMPLESAVNRWYVNDARRILAAMPDLKVIGITGSYGKTSTKHYLHRILSERFSVVMTPGSYNTTLGVVRTIREHLKPYTEVFIVEMGAKQPGDIAEICELVKPQIGIITAVGEQHLESFKTIENVQRTKFELIDALPPDGIAILNNDFELIADRPVTNVAKVLRYASGTGKAAYRIVDVKYGRGETSFAIGGPDDRKSAPFTTRLAGVHNLSNILAGYLAGGVLGMNETEMRHAIASIRQVEHRLEITHTAGGVTIIDDAFNSNPHGAAMALDVLAGFTDGRRIVVTPGMIELGTRQEHYNRELGRQMASACDIAVVVGEYNREAIMDGLIEGGFHEATSESIENKSAVAVATFDDASRYVRETVRAGDTILYENDLPDTFK